ncbi:MAG: choice-of-anchor J domain-containing protein [Bacteroidales bacterium]|nr:choice-of-anchor J domain-containing protein [Bacteroidales bacterium]
MKKLSFNALSGLLPIILFSVFSLFSGQAGCWAQQTPGNIPTYFSGTLTDCHSGLPLNHVMVKAVGADSTFNTTTAEDGTYSLLVVPGTFDVSFFLPGMSKDTIFDTLAVLGVYTEVSTSLCEIPFAPGWVFLDPNEADSKALVTWTGASSGQRDLLSYDLVWIDGFDPNQNETPEDGVKHHWPGNETSPYLDTEWGPRDEGFYAYAARANYTNDTSEWTYSNIAAHKIDNAVTITIECSDDSVPENIEVLLVGKKYPYQQLSGTATVIPSVNQAKMIFDSVIDGYYNIEAFKVGYNKYLYTDYHISNDLDFFIILTEIAYPATNLYVDAVTSVATWDPALITQLPLEDFEEEEFPPEGWQKFDNPVDGGWGWRRDTVGGSNFPVPPGDGYFAINYSTVDSLATDVYLITPKMDLRQSDEYVLYFDHYFTGENATKASIKYSTDDGLTWEVYQEINPVNGFAWEAIQVDLSPLSGLETGLEKVWLAFFCTTNGSAGSGWAIDNVSIHNGPAPIRGYYVYLNESFVAETPVAPTTYTFTDLVYGQSYKASVRSMTTCDLSTPINYYFTSTYLYPPHNLWDAYLQDTDEVPLYWSPPKKIKEPESGTNRDYPKYGIQKSKIEYGTVTNTLAFNRSSAGDIIIESSGSHDYGDVVDEVSPQGIQPWGVCFDGEYLYVTDPFGSAGTVINQLNLDGSPTGYTIDGSAGGPSWVADMACDDGLIYACNVGGDNAIQVYSIENGNLANTISGAWTATSQRGLAHDSANSEFYIGGWNSNNIWRINDNGSTIDEFGFAGVTGLAWHPAGGPAGNGSLWVAENSTDDLVTETDPNAGWPLLQDFSIPSAAGFSGAGLEINSDGMLWVVNQTNGMIYLVDVDEPLIPVYYEVPDGLTGFKVYQDKQWIADVAYNGEGVEDTIFYLVNNLDPACYSFDVSAVYELDSLGFPGETGESMMEGPDTVCVDWGYELPFIEEWSTGNFTFNEWRQDADWVIHNEIGDPEPSAVFSTDLILEDSIYSAVLTSNPLLGNRLASGDIFLDFNLRLDDLNATGDEKLRVEITNDAGKHWQQIAEFSNADGSFDFEEGFQHINISAQAWGYPFRLRFNANGHNAPDIAGWFVDNIHVYHICPPPYGLQAEYFWFPDDNWGVEVCWNQPGEPTPPALWIYWDSGVYTGGTGLTEGGNWSLAQRWDAGQLTDWAGEDLSDAQITKFSLVLNDDGFSSVTLKIWSGPDAGTLLYEQEVNNPIIGEWMEVILDTPVPFDESEELWIGYTITGQPEGMFPGGYDDGPAISGYGDMITTNGTSWDRISDFGIDHNWAVHAFAEELPETTPPIPIVDKTIYSGNSNLSESETVETPIAAPATIGRNVSGFVGFNLYRKEIGVDEDYILYEIIPYVDGQISYCYFDKYPSVTASGQYCYQVTATWVNGNYYCESESAWNIEHTEDYVCVLATAVGEMTEPRLVLYPNPATNQLNINATQSIRQITLFNNVGQVVLSQPLDGRKVVSLETSSYKAGIYILKINTDTEQIIRRIVITKF